MFKTRSKRYCWYASSAEDIYVLSLVVIPDLMINPHAFPSRMTIAQFFETLLGKMYINKGFLSEIVPFFQAPKIISKMYNHKKIIVVLEKYGNEVLYSGRITGQQMKVNFFIGTTYYLRLTSKYQININHVMTVLKLHISRRQELLVVVDDT